MKGFEINIEKSTEENKDFRRVLYTAKHLQLVLMTLKPNEEIGEETHPEIDQFLRFESGFGKCLINGIECNVASGDVIIVPAGAIHNVINTSNEKDLKLYTIYAGPNHKDGVVRATKKEAEEKKEKFDGVTTE
jgi:mannose-6-phosphate isomerase-like protein (cupin superfamily)